MGIQHLASCDEICGYEFDWYAVDLSGQYALFSTAGSSMIPECLFDHIEAYSDIPAPATKTGSNAWAPLAKAGFTVYDMCNSNAYNKVLNATAAMNPALEAELAKLPNLLLFNGLFADTPKITQREIAEFHLTETECAPQPAKMKR